MFLQSILRRTKKSADFYIRFLRLSVFLLVSALGVTWFLTQRVEAQVGEMLLGLGEQMMRLEGSTQGEPSVVAFNGLPVQILQGSVDQPMDEVLDEFESRCASHYSELNQELGALVEAGLWRGEGEPRLDDPTEQQMIARLEEEVDRVEAGDEVGVLRRVDGFNGFVACFQPPEGQTAPNGLLGAIETFGQTEDLSAFGNMRYVFVEGYEEDGEARTHVVSMWTDEPIVMRDLFPVDGADAPGSDPEGLARPPSSRRTLSATVEGQPYGLYLYRRDGDHADGTLRFLRRSLEEAGWAVVPNDETHALSEGEMINAIQGDRVVTYVVNASSGATTTSIMTSWADPEGSELR